MVQLHIYYLFSTNAMVNDSFAWYNFSGSFTYGSQKIYVNGAIASGIGLATSILNTGYFKIG